MDAFGPTHCPQQLLAPLCFYIGIFFPFSSRKRVNKKMRDCVDLDSKVLFNYTSDSRLLQFCLSLPQKVRTDIKRQITQSKLKTE